MIKEYASAKELVGLPFDGQRNWPGTERSCLRKAEALNLPKRQREGSKAWEYQVSAMPEATQIALQRREVHAERAAAQAREAEAQAQSSLNLDELWAWWDHRPGSLKAEAQRRLPIIHALAAALEDGHTLGSALRITAAAHGLSDDTLRRWWKAVKDHHRSGCRYRHTAIDRTRHAGTGRANRARHSGRRHADPARHLC